jgi:membrane-associated phospholipid phosphatase
MCYRNPFSICLRIFISALLIFSLTTFHLSQRSNPQLQSDNELYYGMMYPNNTSNQWKQSSSVTTSLYRNLSEASIQDTSNNNTIVSWNQLITAIGLQKKTPAPYLARDYALMHVAIFDALLQSTNKNKNNEKPAEVAIVAAAAADVLAYLFPENSTSIAALEEQQITDIQGHNTSQIMRGKIIGHDVGKKVIAYAKTDASDVRWNGTALSGFGIWTGSNPIGPLFGHQKTYILSSGAEFQPPPPYPFGSAKDLADVRAVIDAAHSRTPEQIAIVHKWADLPPPTIWNNILNDRIESHNLTIYESARASAYLNTAMYDSFVSCWYTKFTYWTARPFQRIISDPTFTTVIPTPNFPSYTSGHSTISSAASLILGQLFPDEALYFLSEAREAAISRLWAGIHFPQDNYNGFAVGQQIGKKYVDDMLEPLHPFVVPVREALIAPFIWKNNN